MTDMPGEKAATRGNWETPTGEMALGDERDKSMWMPSENEFDLDRTEERRRNDDGILIFIVS